MQRRMDSQYKEMAPREYVDSAIRVLGEKLEASRITREAQIDTVKANIDTRFTELRQDVQNLRESRSEGSGKDKGLNQFAIILAAVIGWAIAIWAIVGKR